MEETIENQSGHLDTKLVSEIEKLSFNRAFKIGEVSNLLEVKPHVLRYWEMEFQALHPKKMPNGQRLYFKKDVEVALLIKKLLYQDGFSLRGAKQALMGLKKENRKYHKKMASQGYIQKELDTMKKIVSSIRSMIE